MKTEILYNGKVLEGSFYSLRLNAAVYFLRPQLQLYGPPRWLETLKKGDKIELKGDGQLLFTGQIEKIKEAERSQVFIGAAEPLERELQLNFSKEKWRNILAEVWPEYKCKAGDFECRHYSHKCSIGEHLVCLHNKLQKRSKKSYWMYLDEQNRLQIHEAGQERGKSPQEGVLIERESSADTYQAFPLLVGTATSEGIAERTELVISNQSEELRVWWAAPNAWGENQNAGPHQTLGPETSQHLAKGEIKRAAEALKNAIFGDGKIVNSSDRTVYAIIDGTEAVVPVYSGNTYSALIDGVVDVEGRQVYKMNENTYLEFTSEYKFIVIAYAGLENLSETLSREPYGVYTISDRAIHSKTGYQSKAMKNWYEKAKEGK